MSIFDFLGKTKKKEQRLENYPQMLNAQLLFSEKPNLNKPEIIGELSKYFSQVDNPSDDNGFSFFFPEFKCEISGTIIPGQCAIIVPEDDNSSIKIPEEAFQQNWHWKNANESAKVCKYSIWVSDLLTRTLDYKQRVDLFIKFLLAVTKATKPQVIYSYSAKKLIEPVQFVKRWDGGSEEILTGLVNVRLFRITDNETADILMDTVGLSYLGLPDFQLLLKSVNEKKIAQLLWNYAYYIFERGDIIENGQTLEGIETNSKWKCERQMALLQPERVVISVRP